MNVCELKSRLSTWLRTWTNPTILINMKSTMKGKKSTEQGTSDTLVPVQGVGDAAGPTGPSANYCQMITKEHGASGTLTQSATTYKWGEGIDPTVRRSSLKRTPPGNNKGSVSENLDDVFHTPKTSTTEQDIWQDEEISVSPIYKLYYNSEDSDVLTLKTPLSPVKKKRKRNTREFMSSDHTSREMTAAMAVLNTLNNKIEELKKEVKLSTKTKTEIKAITREVADIAISLNRKMAVLNTSHTQMMRKIEEQDRLDKTKMGDETTVQKNIPSSQNIGVQADESDIIREISELKDEIRNKVETQIATRAGWTGLERVIDLEWPDSCYRNTEIIELGTLKELKGDLAIIADPNLTLTTKTGDDLKCNFPEITALTIEELEEGCIEFVRTNTEVILSKGIKGVRSRTLYMLPYTTSAEGTNDIRKLHNILEKLGEEAEGHGLMQIQIVFLGNFDKKYLRKCAEWIFRDTSIKIQVITPKGYKQASQKPQGAKENIQTEKVIIKSDGKQYADILRTLKKNVNIDQIGVKVKNIKRTAGGDVLIEVQGGKSEATALKEAIIEKDVQAQVKIKNNEEIIHILDIDGDLNVQQIEEAVKRSVGNAREGDVRLLSCRPNQRGNQTATLAVKKGTATTLIKKGTLKIGWVPCRLRARVNITRCFRCLDFGHHTNECNGEDKTNICLKCGKENHKAKDCNNTSFCLTCKKEGHRAEQTACPYYRKLIRERAKMIGDNRRRHFSAAAEN